MKQNKIIKLFAALIFMLISSESGIANIGLSFDDLKVRLEPYFAAELIDDIKRQLPQSSNYQIWGWDVGDYSSDGHNDVALTVKIKGDKKRIMHVYLFVDIEGYLIKVGDFEQEYFELPLEIGVAIRHDACYVTKKNKLYNWVIYGYRFENGSLIKLDEFHTQRIKRLTHESYENYKTLQNTEKYFYTNTGKVKFWANYLVLPSYPRGRKIYKGYEDEVYCNYVDYVPIGAYHWRSDSDLSFSVKSAYDRDYLYMTVMVNDSDLVIKSCDTCMADFVEVWFDINTINLTGDRFSTKKGGRVVFRESSEAGIYSFKFALGDFLESRAYLEEISTTDDLESYQKDAINQIKAVSSLKEGGYQLKFKIPFLLFGFEEAPVDEEISEFGFSVRINDIDNEFRPEERSVMASSDFQEHNTLSYGSLKFIPMNLWYGESNNIYKDDIIKHLTEMGF